MTKTEYEARTSAILNNENITTIGERDSRLNAAMLEYIKSLEAENEQLRRMVPVWVDAAKEPPTHSCFVKVWGYCLENGKRTRSCHTLAAYEPLDTTWYDYNNDAPIDVVNWLKYEEPTLKKTTVEVDNGKEK